jgi:hypothetical protein
MGGQYNFTSSMGLTPSNLAGIGDTETVGGNTWTFTKATGTIVLGQLCQIDDNGNAGTCTTTTAASTVKGCGPAQFAVATNEYFWLPTGPFNLKHDGSAFVVKAALNCAKDVPLYTTGTAGVVDDSSTVLVSGLTLTEDITTAALADCKAAGMIRLTT